MKKVPFYGNHEDNLHCAVAVYRMLFDHFLDRKIGWQEMEKMAGFQPGKAAWTVTIWERMSKQGFDIRMIEPFDYERYETEGQSYLRSYFNSDAQYDWQIKNTNILEIRPYIKSFLAAQSVEYRQASLQDIDEMLADERLVFVTLNSKFLNDRPGYATHAVLIIDKEGNDYIVHDPGLPPAPYRHVAAKKLWQAMGAEKTTSEVTGIKFKPRPMRADQVLANQYPLFSRAALSKLFEKGLVTHKGKALKPGARILSDVVLDADLSSLQVSDATIDLPILYEDDNILVINKPAGILAHTQGAFNPEATVATFLRKHVTELTGERAGIVHRLDRPTSGVMVCAKNPKAMSFLQKQFADRTVEKTYTAIIEGHLRQDEALVDMPIERNPKAPATFRVGPNGKPATTHYKVIKRNEHASLLELKPKTGRTHQLRVHLHQLGHPIIGDPLYGKGAYGDRLYLHAHRLQFIVPETNERKTFTAPLPPEFNEFMER